MTLEGLKSRRLIRSHGLFFENHSVARTLSPFPFSATSFRARGILMYPVSKKKGSPSENFAETVRAKINQEIA